MVMDAKIATLIGVSMLTLSKMMPNKSPQLTRGSDIGATANNDNMDNLGDMNVINGPFDVYESDRYKISFQYPSSWRRNPRYEDKYEGKTGFFEITDFDSTEDNINEAVQQEVKEPYSPFGSNPVVLDVTVDGQPGRIIYPSADQSDYFVDRDAALLIQYPTPIELNDKPYTYVIIWASRDYIPILARTLKFVN